MMIVEENYTVANMSAECLKNIIELENDLTGKTNQNIVLIAYEPKHPEQQLTVRDVISKDKRKFSLLR